MIHRRVIARWMKVATVTNLQVFDFDDTLVSSQGSVSVKKANGEDLNMDSATFAHYTPSDGDELDFGAFNDVINPRVIKKNFDHLKESLGQSDTKVVILTARSKGAESSVAKFLESLGVKGVQVVGLGSSDPEDKANWIDQAIKDEGAKTMDFFDDSAANAAAVAGHADRHPGIKYKSHNTPHPHEADYDGPTIKTHFKSSNPQNAKVKYKPKTKPDHVAPKPSKSNWWDDQTDTFQRKYCDDHPASMHCGSVRLASNDTLMKKIHDRAQKSGNKKIIGYVEILDEKMGQAGSHAGAWFEGLEKSFDDFRRKPEGLFKGFTSKDFDDLHHALFGTTPKKESHMNRTMAQRVAARHSIHKVANAHILGSLLACLRAAHQAHWTAHWTAEGDNFYGDHQLFERLYTAIPGEIDGLAEKIVALYGSHGVALPDQMVTMARYIDKWMGGVSNLVNRAYNVEADVQEAIRTTRNVLEAEGNMSLGMDNFLQGLADAHETPGYLLGQRMKAKTASGPRDRGNVTTIPKRIQLALDGLGLKADGGYFTKDNNSELFTAWLKGKVVTTLMYDSDTKTWVPYQRKPWRPKNSASNHPTIDPKTIKITKMYADTTDEWANFNVEVTGPWDRPSGREAEKDLAEAIFTAAMQSPDWDRLLARVPNSVQTIDEYANDYNDDYGDDDDGDGDGGGYRRDREPVYQATSVPIPRAWRHIEHWNVSKGEAFFSMSDRN